MGKLYIVLTVLLGAVFSSQDGISGSELYPTVRPGDNITVYCDCKISTGVYIVWYRNCSHANQPSLVLRTEFDNTEHFGTRTLPFPRFDFVKNETTQSYDLLIKSITDSDQGLYYCGTEETSVVNKTKITGIKVYKYGNVTTWIRFNSSISEPPHPGCGLCWVLLYTLCPAFAVLSCLLSSVLFYYLCQRTAKEPQGHQRRPDEEGIRGNQDEDGLCYAALDIRQTSRRPKKKKDQSSNFSTYSAINTSRI